MAFGGLLDGFLQEKTHGVAGSGSGRKPSVFHQPMRKDTYSMHQNREMMMGGSEGDRKMSTMSMMHQPKKFSTISAVSVDVYPKYSWHGSR